MLLASAVPAARGHNRAARSAPRVKPPAFPSRATERKRLRQLAVGAETIPRATAGSPPAHKDGAYVRLIRKNELPSITIAASLRAARDNLFAASEIAGAISRRAYIVANSVRARSMPITVPGTPIAQIPFRARLRNDVARRHRDTSRGFARSGAFSRKSMNASRPSCHAHEHEAAAADIAAARIDHGECVPRRLSPHRRHCRPRAKFSARRPARHTAALLRSSCARHARAAATPAWQRIPGRRRLQMPTPQ